jgi:hypothetical protein
VNGIAASAKRGVSIVIDPTDTVASSSVSLWAAEELEKALSARGVTTLCCQRITQANAGDVCLIVAGLTSPLAKDVLKKLGAIVEARPEALGVFPAAVEGRRVTLVCGHDPRAMVFALLDLADRVQNASDPVASLDTLSSLAEQSANEVRSITRPS